LLGRFTDTIALIEAFRNAATKSEVRSCMSKLFDTCTVFEREAKRNDTRVEENCLPKLWILSPTASEDFIEGLNTRLDVENWAPGIYFLGNVLRTAVVAIHQLPVTPETLWLRLLGKGRVQQRAIEEIQALEFSNPLREKAIGNPLYETLREHRGRVILTNPSTVLGYQ